MLKVFKVLLHNCGQTMKAYAILNDGGFLGGITHHQTNRKVFHPSCLYSLWSMFSRTQLSCGCSPESIL